MVRGVGVDQGPPGLEGVGLQIPQVGVADGRGVDLGVAGNLPNVGVAGDSPETVLAVGVPQQARGVAHLGKPVVRDALQIQGVIGDVRGDRRGHEVSGVSAVFDEAFPLPVVDLVGVRVVLGCQRHLGLGDRCVAAGEHITHAVGQWAAGKGVDGAP